MSEEKKAQENLQEAQEDTQEDGVSEEVQEKVRQQMEDKDEIHSLVDTSKSIVESVEKEIRDEMDKLNADLEKLSSLEQEVLNTTLKTAEELLREVGYEEDLSNVEFVPPAFEYDKKDKPPIIKEPSSGKFSAFILGILGGFATVGGITYYYLQKLGIDPNLLANKEQIIEILKEVGKTITGTSPNEYVGGAALGGAFLIVFLIIYKIFVAVKASRNLKLAQELHEEAHIHKSKREERKEQIKGTDEHVNRVMDVLDKLNVILEEYNAKLKRILHLEGAKNFQDYHEKSKKDIEDAYRIAREIKILIITPEAVNGELNQESIEVLRENERVLNEILQKLY